MIKICLMNNHFEYILYYLNDKLAFTFVRIYCCYLSNYRTAKKIPHIARKKKIVLANSTSGASL